MIKGYQRKKIYTIHEVLNKRVPTNAPKKDSFVDFEGDWVSMRSQRYAMFDLKGTDCVECGIKGAYFAKEKPPGNERYHFNLYAMNDNGTEVLMTKDHITPKSKRGRNHVSNYQPMCDPCNRKKGDSLE